ncbi:PREDICTED: D-aspartate oxidase-like, partial [Pterocles gutturalis]|uniref:D-aspartate oxidase-like n=1 Tax=Pterocles gutturalis TaxID=240206 RepID=UPI000528E511
MADLRLMRALGVRPKRLYVVLFILGKSRLHQGKKLLAGGEGHGSSRASAWLLGPPGRGASAGGGPCLGTNRSFISEGTQSRVLGERRRGRGAAGSPRAPAAARSILCRSVSPLFPGGQLFQAGPEASSSAGIAFSPHLWLCLPDEAAPKVAVVGAGVIGLSTALCIRETWPSCSVTVLSDQFSPNTTSDVAAGMLIPHTYPGTPTHVQKQWFKETFSYLFAISNSAEASEAGIHLISGWQVFKNTPEEELPFWSDVVLGFRAMSEAELQKFPHHRFGQAFTTLKCDCPPYLLWLEK